MPITPVDPAGREGRTATLERPRASRSRGVAWQLEERRRFRSALLGLLLTLVAPGAVQVRRGDRRLGLVALGTWAALLLTVVLVAALVPTETLASWFVRSWVLTGARVLAVVLALGWVALLVDAWRLGDPPSLTRKHRLAMVATTVVACLLVAVPLGYGSHYAQVARDDVVALFPEGEAAAASGGRLNILLLGGDADEGRPGVRTDSINVASVDTTTGRTVLFSLPRNLQGAPFPAGTELAQRFPDGFQAPAGEETDAYLLNAVYEYAAEHPEVVPGAQDPGAEAVKQVVATTLGIDVPYYVLVNMDGFRDLVDALGGVRVDVQKRVTYQVGGEQKAIDVGPQQLTGRQTLAYARQRKSSDDYTRMGRQRCVLGAILRQADPATVLARFGSLAAALGGLMSTDIPQASLPDLLPLAALAREEGVRTVAFVPPLITTAEPDWELIRSTVRTTLEGSQAGTLPTAAPSARASGGSGERASSGPSQEPSGSASARTSTSQQESRQAAAVPEAIDARC